jgi:DNA-directed RNA polymerase specialized sigma24 family protein
VNAAYVNSGETTGWCEALYHAKASELILYGRALGLGHGEAEDVLHETFLALMRRAVSPALPERYCVRSFRNRALNYRRSLWRRLAPTGRPGPGSSPLPPSNCSGLVP